MGKKKAIIIGAGPAGLTAAYELLKRTDIQPIVLEKSNYMGGISRTINYKGNRIDIGGHRFFSKSDRVMNWWMNILPVQASGEQLLAYQGKSHSIHVAQKTAGNKVMLVRPRKSRIYFMRTFFDYPLKLSLDTLRKLGPMRVARIGASYSKSVMLPLREEKNLEQFLINRFGRELYHTFFKSYTEKVWGVPCHEISSEWGAQRIKGLSITKALVHGVKQLLKKKSDVAQKGVETSLIEQFLYPAHGPGQMWEEVARQVIEMGGVIQTDTVVEKIFVEGDRVVAVQANVKTGNQERIEGDYFFSTMPVKELVQGLQTNVPEHVKHIANGLQYRDFITVGLLCKRLSVTDTCAITDNWIYIQEPDVQVGRLQIFNNWSPHMVADPDKVWIGLEYFCYDTDTLWKMTDADLIALAKGEIEKIGIAKQSDVEDATVIRMEKTYPAYFGAYAQFDQIRTYADCFTNLFLVGRNGMHKYNNQDHSMLTAMVAVDNIIAGNMDKSSLWAVNTEGEYHEEKK